MHLIYIYSFFLNSVHEILLGIKLLISISITASFKSKQAKNFLSVSHYIISLTDFFNISEVKILDRFQFLLFFKTLYKILLHRICYFAHQFHIKTENPYKGFFSLFTCHYVNDSDI